MTSARGEVIGPSDRPGPPRFLGQANLQQLQDVSKYEPLYVGHKQRRRNENQQQTGENKRKKRTMDGQIKNSGWDLGDDGAKGSMKSGPSCGQPTIKGRNAFNTRSAVRSTIIISSRYDPALP